MGELVRVDRHGRDSGRFVEVVCFNRPGQLNAMNVALALELREVLGRQAADPGLAAVVLTGAGRAFMAGADLREYAAMDAASFEHFQRSSREIYRLLESMPVPTIAAVSGYALGGGFEIALACDLIVADESARMGLPEVRLGLVPGGGGTQRLARKAGSGCAFDLLASGRYCDAGLLQQRGVVSRLAQPGKALEQALAWAHELAAEPAEAVAAVKRLVQCASPVPSDDALDAEVRELVRLFTGSAARERIDAFLARKDAR